MGTVQSLGRNLPYDEDSSVSRSKHLVRKQGPRDQERAQRISTKDDLMSNDHTAAKVNDAVSWATGP